MNILFLFYTLLLVSCATTHPGMLGKKLTSNSDLDLHISGKVVKSYSNQAHRFLDFTFENTGKNWERIKSIDFKYGNDKKLIYNVIVGQDLIIWGNALSEKLKKDNHNITLALSGLMLGGAALAASGGGSNFGGTVGVGALAIGAGGALAHGINNDLKRVETSKVVPTTHLLNSFAVPAGMYIRRWVLINVPGDRWATTAYLTVNTLDGRSEEYRVPIY